MELPPLETGHIPQADILERVQARREEWIEFLAPWLALMESPSLDPREPGFTYSTCMGWKPRGTGISGPAGVWAGRERRDAHGTGQKPASRRSSPRFQLLIGHTDTVWPEGTLDQMPVELENGHLRGPGIFDMKAGLTHMVFALRALKELGLEPEVEPVLFINSDEEIGSGESERHIRRLARRACRAYVLEPALDLDGKLKTARKGVGRFVVRLKGRGSHAGLAPQEGISAIQELSHVIQTLHGLTDFERGIVVNVGQIRGGTRPNVVAAAAEAVIDVRVNTTEEGDWIHDQIHAIEPITPGVTLEIEGSVDRPPLERTPQNRVLWKSARALGAAMGLELEEGRAGGGSDGNTTNQYTPTLDGLGAVGDGAHALHEYIDVDRTLERCALLAGLLLLPAPALPRLSTTGVVAGLEEGEGSGTRSP
jgi:glutamate carboxypeptidase